MVELSLIVPCYNEEKNIEIFMNECVKTFDNDTKVEYIFVNDGSKDETWKMVKKIKEEYQDCNIIGISFSRNFGKEAAILAGLKKSTGDYVAIIDADLQQHPKYVQKMLDYIVENDEYDCIACYPEKRIGNKFINSLSNLFYKLIDKISDIDFYQNASDFRLMKRNVISEIINMQEYYRFSKGLFSFVGFNTYYMSYQIEERKYGKSSWSVFKRIKYAFSGIIDFSISPLKLATFIGFISFSLSLVYLIALIIEKLTIGIKISGYPTIISLILFFGGLQMIFLGIFGEYLGRTYMETKKRPIYIVKEEINNKNNDEAK